MRHALLAAALGLVAAFGAGGATVAPAKAKPKPKPPLTRIKHIVVIYEENHSFDNLYGGWEGVNGRPSPTNARARQVDEAGSPYDCLMQVDVNLTTPPQPASCSDTRGFQSAFTNGFFAIDPQIPATATTCPEPARAFSFPNGVKN